MWGRPLAWSTARIWALQAGGADEPGVIWCGTLPGGLFRSTDHGESWEMVRSLWDHPKRKQWMGGGADLPGIHSIVVDPRNSKRVSVAVSTGGIWFTRGRRRDLDAARRGHARRVRAAGADPRPHRPGRALPRAMPGRAAAHVGAASQRHLRLVRRGQDVRRRSPTSSRRPSAFAVVVHPREPDTAWFVPEIKDEKRIPRDGKLVVTRTRDGGKSFDVLTQAACRSATPTTSSIATRWRSTRPATGSRSARPPAACG